MRRASASPFARDGDRIRRLAEHGYACLLGEDPELLDGCRPLKVSADEQGIAALLAEPSCELG